MRRQIVKAIVRSQQLSLLRRVLVVVIATFELASLLKEGGAGLVVCQDGSNVFKLGHAQRRARHVSAGQLRLRRRHVVRGTPRSQ